MKCELKKMKHDVVKDITLKNIITGIGLIVVCGIITVALVIALVLVMGMFIGVYRGNEIIKSILPWLHLLEAILWCTLFYLWYKQSHEWCNNRGPKQ